MSNLRTTVKKFPTAPSRNKHYNTSYDVLHIEIILQTYCDSNHKTNELETDQPQSVATNAASVFPTIYKHDAEQIIKSGLKYCTFAPRLRKIDETTNKT